HPDPDPRPVQDRNHDPGEREGTERPPAPKRPLLAGHPFRILLALVIVAACVIGGFMFWTYRSTFETTDDAEVDGHIIPISPRVGGRILDVKVDNNQQVAQGQVLVQLDPTDYRVASQRAQADLQQAQADARAAQSQVPIVSLNTSSQISTAGASVEEAQAGISVAQQQSEAALARVREAEANA